MALTDKVLMLGVDGLDPSLTRKFVDQGKLPNIQKFIERGAQKHDLKLLCTPPTITPPLWTTLATGALPVTHGITCFWRQDPVHLDTAGYNLDSRLCKAEPLWNVTAEAGMKTLVWHWPGSSWPPTSDSPNLHVVDGTQPAAPNSGVERIEMEKMTYASTRFEKVNYKPGATNNTGAGCVIEDVPEADDTFDTSSVLGGDAMSMRNIILKQSDGEDGIEDVSIDLCNSPVKEAKGWTDAPEGAKEFYVVTSNGVVASFLKTKKENMTAWLTTTARKIRNQSSCSRKANMFPMSSMNLYIKKKKSSVTATCCSLSFPKTATKSISG